jgi:hypothetical protein
MVDVVTSLEGGAEVLNTRTSGTPLAFQVGVSNKRACQGTAARAD